MTETLVNRVAESGIITINLEDFYPSDEFINFDIKDYLFHGLIVKEKEFRESVKGLSLDDYNDKIVLIHCSADAIIPLWVYMLLSSKFAESAKEIYLGSKEDYLNKFYQSRLSEENWLQYEGQRVVIKGCSNKPVPASAYAYATLLLKPYAQSIMFGEPCSTVPIFKRPRVI